MAYTNSIAFPNMFAVSKNQLVVAEGDASVVNRTRLLMLTEPTELYNEPDFGVGLKRHLWKYNKPIEKEKITDRTKEQLRLHEPCVIPDSTEWGDGLIFTGSESDFTQKENKLEMTLAVKTIYGDMVDIELEGV